MTIDEIEFFRKQCNKFFDRLIEEQIYNQHIREGDIVTIPYDNKPHIVTQILDNCYVLKSSDSAPDIVLKNVVIKTGWHCPWWRKYRKKTDEYYGT